MQSLKKILHITTVHNDMDVRIFYKECKSLANCGYKVVLLAPSLEHRSVENIEIVPLPLAKNRIDRMTRVLFLAVRIALKQKADIYHFHDPELILAGFIFKFFGKKVIYDVHENISEDIMVKDYIPYCLRKIVTKFVNSLEIIASKIFDALIVVTPKIAERFSLHKTFLVRNFPVIGEFDLEANQTYNDRPKAGLYAGGISSQRGIVEMVNAFSILPADLSAYLNLAGSFQSKNIFQKTALLPGWKYVNYHGTLAREKLKYLFDTSRFGLVLFHPDNNHIHAYPNKLFEYMSAGLPVIASDFPLWREIVSDANCGLLVDPMDEQAIADAIDYLLTHSAEAEQMGKNGRQAVLKNYSWQSEAKTLLSVYENILNN